VVRRKDKKRLFQFNQEQRRLYSSRFTELGNLVIVTLVFSQFLTKEVNSGAIVAGIVAWITAYFLSYCLLKAERRR